MAFRLVSSGGAVTDAAVVDLPASGAIYKDGVVVFDAAAAASNSFVSRAGAGSPCTAIIGVALKHVDGASDVDVPVILFDDSQLWEADCVSAASSAQLMMRHILDDALTVENISSVSESGSAGVFLALRVTGATTGSGKLIGKFLRRTQIYPSTLWSVAAYNAN